MFFNLIDRLLQLKSEGEVVVDDDPVSHAINHPVGHVTEALLRWWYRQDPKEGQGLPNRTKLLFTELCNTQVPMYRHGRVLLAAHAIALFQVDERWVKTHLLSLFDWHKSELEARAAWEGFLWSPRLYQPFLSAIKQPMLEAAIHYKLLSKHAHQFAAFLTYAALNLGETFTRKELAYATRALPVEGLQGTAQTLVLALEGAGEQREAYWHNRVLPYFKFIWPKSVDVITPAISESFARLCIEAREAFPEAFGQLKHWLKPVNHPDYLIDRLSESTIPRQFPTETLMFLNSIIGDDAQWLPQELGQCLEEIKRANLKLVSDERYTRLNNLLRRRGIS